MTNGLKDSDLFDFIIFLLNKPTDGSIRAFQRKIAKTNK